MAGKRKNPELQSGIDALTTLWRAKGEVGLMQDITDGVIEGKTLSDIAKGMNIPYAIVWRWVRNSEIRMKEYMEALEARADFEAGETIKIADDAQPEDVATAKLRIDTRLKLASKWDRKRYGEQVKVENSVAVVDEKLILEGMVELLRLAVPKPIEVPFVEVVDERTAA